MCMGRAKGGGGQCEGGESKSHISLEMATIPKQSKLDGLHMSQS